MPTLMDAAIEISGRRIGAGEPPYVVAELSGNHGQDFDRAVQLVEAAARAGAAAIKLQTYTPETMTLDLAEPPFQIEGTPWAGRTLFDLYRRAATPWQWHPRLMEIAGQLGLHAFATPFDPTAVDFLESLGVPAYKIASFELVDLPLLTRVARTGKPMILSTGMATLEEIAEALETVRAAGGRQVALLKCTSAYPASPAAMNLRTLPHLAETFGVPVGLSDHSLSLSVPAAAVALGAAIVEKHLTLSRSQPGSDAAFSLEPAEFQAMVEAVRTAYEALGRVAYGAGPEELPARRLRRSLFVVCPIRAGEPFTRENLRAIRPGDGLPPRYLDQILGRRASRDLRRGTPLGWEHVTE
jgi:N-acetylneuraminate synthase